MVITLLQLNIYGGMYWEELLPYLTTNDFDIIHLQELVGANTLTGKLNSKRDVYAELLKKLQHIYDSELAIAQRYTSSPFAYMGNATFFKKTFSLIEKKEITISTYGGAFPSDSKSFESVGRKILHLILKIDNKNVSFINTHLAWAKTPKEEPHQTEQGKKVIEYLQSIPHPFVFSGDFNLDPQQQTIQNINKLARNLTEEFKVSNTLNPRTHRAKELFPPGVAVDYIYITGDLKIKDFAVIQEDISDHFGLTAEIEI